MPRPTALLLAAALLLASAPASQADITPLGRRAAQGKPVTLETVPPVTTDNQGGVIAANKANITLEASSTFGGWPVENAIDGNVESSWYSDSNDSAAKGTAPWLMVVFAQPVQVTRVTIIGNRDPQYLNGYTILAGVLQAFDGNDKELARQDSEGTGNFRDFDFRFAKPLQGVKKLRFTSVADQGNENPYGDIAIAEVQVE